LLDDWPHFMWSASDGTRTIRGTDEVGRIWEDEFEGIRGLGGSYVLTMHPQIIGRPSRLRLLDRMLELASRAEDVWIATCAEIAAHADRLLPAAGTSHG
jgi:hypothetical protein